ncbi:hypothetical protein RUM43_012736 [Polyplax serrata]|uniref:Uncharacterized protein n=1 Tax=Polyplax serrata TaxID=468196 RepID=A0AAN8P615_POLSC
MRALMKAQGMLSPESERRHDGHDFGATSSKDKEILNFHSLSGDELERPGEEDTVWASLEKHQYLFNSIDF